MGCRVGWGMWVSPGAEGVGCLVRWLAACCSGVLVPGFGVLGVSGSSSVCLAGAFLCCSGVLVPGFVFIYYHSFKKKGSSVMSSSVMSSVVCRQPRRPSSHGAECATVALLGVTPRRPEYPAGTPLPGGQRHVCEWHRTVGRKGKGWVGGQHHQQQQQQQAATAAARGRWAGAWWPPSQRAERAICGGGGGGAT
eukprot:COSAG01_NODE_5656_length_4115_cov_3.312749_1_plen_194_part_00